MEVLGTSKGPSYIYSARISSQLTGQTMYSSNYLHFKKHFPSTSANACTHKETSLRVINSKSSKMGKKCAHEWRKP